MKKRFLTAAAAALCAVSLAACGGSSTATTAAETQTSEAADTTAAEADAAEEETAAEAEETEEGGTLIMATNAEFPPYEYHDSSQTGPDGSDIVGIDAEIAGAIAEKLGKDLVIEDIAFDSLIPELQSGKADFVAAGMTVTEDRLVNVDFSDTYATAVQSIIVTSDSEIAGPDDLAGKKIGVQQGTTGDLYATDDFGDENIDRYPKGVDAVQALVQGKVDAVIIDNEPAKVFVGDNEGLKLLDTAYAEEEYAIAVKKGNTELLEQINTVIQELKDSGEMDSIIGKYITAE
ncbi:MAG TPA: basic amino acid ABC transporter substrate-binding protein [Candidatus Caccovicinus merdipullorum]|uniref:Basic amino acid ABC transporter substrate-binding protein n=1 Tax=Candidatus Caccovicinus merdipullorum TaxID=2840724 RepID=A0A9D1GHU0_9FIRM|nr:basic amino acid ABC transporter substrate-binding protein [Candidatus Caccovicinus merdipullorum]